MPKLRYCSCCPRRVRPTDENHFVVDGKDYYLCAECRRECVEAWLWHEVEKHKQEWQRH